jgi:hypothetical protein
VLMQTGVTFFRHLPASQAATSLTLRVLPSLPLAGGDWNPLTANVGDNTRVEVKDFTNLRGLGGGAKIRAIILHCSAVCAPARRS